MSSERAEETDRSGEQGVQPSDGAPQVEYRRATQEDAAEVLRLFEEVFGEPRSREHWMWQYMRSDRSGLVELLRARGRVVGCAALMRQDLNHLGERVYAAQACDGMLDERFRGRGAYTALARRNYNAAREAGLRFIIGFPNRKSLPVLVRELGHTRVLVLRHYQRRLGAARLWGQAIDRLMRPTWRAFNRLGLKVLQLRQRRRFSMTVTTEVDPSWEELTDRHNAQQVLSAWKDPEYLRWRYAEHPDHRYIFHVLEDHGRPVALAVIRLQGETAAICEIMHRGRDTRETAELLRRIVSWYGQDADLQVVEFYGHDVGFFQTAFHEAGFTASAHSPLAMIVAPLSDDDPLADTAKLSGSWTIAYGDTDIV